MITESDNPEIQTLFNMLNESVVLSEHFKSNISRIGVLIMQWDSDDSEGEEFIRTQIKNLEYQFEAVKIFSDWFGREILYLLERGIEHQKKLGSVV